MAGPLRNCCVRFPLRTGSIIAGVATIILSILTILGVIFLRLHYKTIFFDWIPHNIVKGILIFNLCMTIIISAIMIVGAVKRNHYLMLPWVVLGFMLIISLLLTVIYQFIIYLIDGFLIVAVAWLAIGLLVTAIDAYMWTVVYSFFTELREESKRGKYNRQPYRR